MQVKYLLILLLAVVVCLPTVTAGDIQDQNTSIKRNLEKTRSVYKEESSSLFAGNTALEIRCLDDWPGKQIKKTVYKKTFLFISDFYIILSKQKNRIKNVLVERFIYSARCNLPCIEDLRGTEL